MPKKQLAAEIASAMDTASREALSEAISKLPNETTLGSLLKDLGSSRPAEMLRSLPLSELVTVLSANGTESQSTVRRTPKRKKSRRTRKRSLNGSVSGYLRKAGKAKAEEIRAEIGGTPEDIRRLLFELKEQKRVRRTGAGRATTWHWRG